MNNLFFIKKLETLAGLTDEQRCALSSIDGTVRQLRRGDDIASEGEKPDACTMVLSGLLCRYKMLPDGKRQIMSFHIPGDMPDLHSLFVSVMDHSLGAIAPTTIMSVPHQKMREVLAAEPLLKDLLWRDTLIDAAIFREWTVSLGRRPAMSE